MQMYNYISKTFFIMAFSMLCSFFATIFLANQVSTETFGLLSLLKSLFPMCSMILLMGIDKSYIKIFSKVKLKKTAQYILPIIFIYGFFITFIFSKAYNLYEYFIVLYLCITIGAINLFLAAFFRLKNSYGIAQFITSGHKVVFLVAIIVYTYIDIITSHNLIAIYALSLLIPSYYIVRYLKLENLESDSTSLSDFLKMYKKGILFFCINILNLFIVNMERLVIPLIYGNNELGIYTALTFVYITIFTMIGTSIGYVLFPELSKDSNISYRKLINISIWIIAIFSIIFYFFGFQFNSIIYNQKFDIYRTSYIDFIIISIGILQFINGLLHWFILGVGKKDIFILYLKLIIFALVLYSLIMFIALKFLEISFINVIPIVLFGWFIKVSLTFLFVIRNRPIYLSK